MADQFGLPVTKYAETAFKAELAPKFSYGCAVFLDSDRVNFQKEGYAKEELLAGLALVLPKNIWQYVVQIPRMSELGRVFVNIEDKNSVDVIDIATHKVIANWPVAPASEPTGMAIDLANHRIFVGGGPNTVMMDARTGKVLASMPICSGTDATWFDPGTKMVFSSCGGNNGQITAGHVDGPDKLTVVQTIATLRGARTMTLDTATHNLYVVGQKYAPGAAAAPAGGRGGPPAIADSFHVMILGMGK
jgi:hypothetical protein